MCAILHFLKCEDGPTAVEYAVMLALIAAVCIVGVRSFGQATNDSLDDSATQLASMLGS